MRFLLVSLIMVPISAAIVLFVTAYVGKFVCVVGNGLCNDNIIPGAIVAAVAFGLGHIVATCTFRSRWRWASYLAGIAVALCVALHFIYATPDRPNAIIAAVLWTVWSCLYLVECLLKVPCNLYHHRFARSANR